MGDLIYPISGRDTAKSGMGCHLHRGLNHLVERISRNVGGSHMEMGSPSVKDASVGGPMVVGGRESRVQGEGGQGIDVRWTISQGSPWESLVALDNGLL